MMKLLGAVIIIASTTSYGFYRAFLYSKRVNHLKQLIFTLNRLKSDIKYSYTILPEAFHNVSTTLEPPFSTFFSYISEQLQQTRSDKSFQMVWEEAIEQLMFESELKKEQYNILQRLGYVLGTSDMEDQVQHLQQAIDRLVLEEELAIEEHNKYATLWRNLGALVGIALVILLV